MCLVCRCTPCAALCPNAEPNESIGTCAICGEPIYSGDWISTNGKEAVHSDCRSGLTIEELLEFEGMEVSDPIRYASDPDMILKAFGFNMQRA